MIEFVPRSKHTNRFSL